jgi:hypothetical protein
MDLRILFWTGAAVLLRRRVAVHRETGRLNVRRREKATVESPAPVDASPVLESGPLGYGDA